MCKQVIIPNASKIVNFDEFVNKMSKSLSDQRDGFGFCAMGKDGVFGSRTLSPKSFSMEKPPSFAVGNRFDFGNKSEVIGSAMFHGRVSTNYISINNTHPISKGGWHLVHNGVVSNKGPKYQQTTSNDSEHVLHHLMTGGLEAVAKNLTGYYAAGAFDPEGQLHIVRDSIASLYVAYSDKLESYVFATTTDLIDDVAEFTKEELICYRLKDDIYLVFKNNALVYESRFESLGWDDYSAGWSHQSLGYGLTAADFIDLDDSPTDLEIAEYDSLTDDLYDVDLTLVSDTYWEELDLIDRDYLIHDIDYKQIELEVFRSLPVKQQVLCEIRKPDGVLLNPYRIDRAG